jgi:DNA-binding response OmpR family regulator
VRKRAVIFDDEDLCRRVLWLFFDQRGYEVFTFPYPDLCPLHLALECPCPLGTSCSDIIISDANMLGNNRIDFIEKLIEKGCKQRHFALMSGAFTDSDRERASQLGCAVFEKPVDLEALTAWIESVEKSILAERVPFDWTQVE